MRIRKEDLPLGTEILDFGPNWFTHSIEKKGDIYQLQTSFRSNEKYSRRLWFAFEPLWWMFHAWDMATKPWPVLNLGFDTLPTKYSTPGATVSGYAEYTQPGQTFATIRGGAGNASGYDGGEYNITARVVSGGTSNTFNTFDRGLFLFDCSALGSSVTVSSAVIGLYCDYIGSDLGSFDMDIVSSSPTSNTVLANGDYTKLGTTPFSSVVDTSLTTGQYNSFTLNASGLSNISKTGISKFGVTVNWDTDGSFGGTWGSGKYSGCYFTDGGAASTTKDPKIDITYNLPLPVCSAMLGFNY